MLELQNCFWTHNSCIVGREKKIDQEGEEQEAKNQGQANR
jgi:hypothetical protein